MWILFVLLLQAHGRAVIRTWLFNSHDACAAAAERFQDDDRFIADCYVEKIRSVRT